MEKRKLKILIPKVFSEPDNYVNAIRNLGAEPIVTEMYREFEAYDGLILPGGADVNPRCYGQENTASLGIDDALDQLQLMYLELFVKEKKPVLGICRGHQLINVYFGGTLIQHLSTSEWHSRCGGDQDKVHVCRAEQGSFIDRLYGTALSVNSAHHQAVDILGKGLHAVMYAEDGTVEGMYHEALPVYSVQWHPERMCFAHKRNDTVDGSRILRFFLELCEGTDEGV